jgi:hypothetical protein
MAALRHAQSGRVGRHQEHGGTARPGVHLDHEQPGDGRIGDALLAAVDHPAVVRAKGRSLAGPVARLGAMIVDPERGIAARLVLREREVITVVGEEGRQEAFALLRRHQPAEQGGRERRGLCEHGGDIGIADGKLLGDDAAGEMIGARAARFLGERERTQPELRGLVERTRQQRARLRLEPRGVECGRLDLLRHEIAYRVADFQLLGAQAKIVHAVAPKITRP